MKELWHDYMINSERWQDASDGWVKSMHESREMKEKKNFCNHGDFEWCENCLTTVDGEKIETV